MVGLVFVCLLVIISGLSSKRTFFVVIVSESFIVWEEEGANSSSMLNMSSVGGVGGVSDSENFLSKVSNISCHHVVFLPSSVDQVIHIQLQVHWSMERLPSLVEQMPIWIDHEKQAIVDILAYTCGPHEDQAGLVGVLSDR